MSHFLLAHWCVAMGLSVIGNFASQGPWLTRTSTDSLDASSGCSSSTRTALSSSLLSHHLTVSSRTVIPAEAKDPCHSELKSVGSFAGHAFMYRMLFFAKPIVLGPSPPSQPSCGYTYGASIHTRTILRSDTTPFCHIVEPLRHLRMDIRLSLL